MKVLCIVTRLNVGGVTKQVVSSTGWLRDEECEIVLIAGRVPSGEEDMSYLATECEIEPVYVKEMSRELSFSDLIAWMKILAHVWRQRPDIIHTHTAKAGTLGRSAAFVYRWLSLGTFIGRRRSVGVVHTFHGHVFHSYYGRSKTAVFIFIEKLLARFATDRIVVISGQQLREISDEARIGKLDQFRVVPYGLDLAEFGSAADTGLLRQETGARDNEILVVFVGRLTGIKDVELLLNSLTLTGDEPAIRTAIIGEGELRVELETLSERNGTTNRVHFLGNRSDVAGLVAGADIVALTSRNEGTPLSLIEAMAAGKAVISTVVGGVIDLLGEVNEQGDGFSIHERGIGIHDRDPQHYANGLARLASDKKLRDKLGSAARQFVLQQYSMDRFTNETKALYRELITSDQ